ncbi:MAG TPA: DUF6798 domain-containing protein, partial [Terriglobia bacterium]|nr:DUF6798 domain-containing protein [Terriglobia bacterium]
TFAGLLIHGYHPAAEDGEIYIPGIKKILNPNLYPFGSEFFLNHARMTQFGNLIAATVRISHLSFDTILFLWYVASLFLTLLACWEWSGEFFEEPEARWSGVCLFAGLLTLPVAGTSLYIFDQYVTPRSIVLFALLFATLNAWRGRYVRFVFWSAFAALVHPLMAGFGISFALLLICMKYVQSGHKQPISPAFALLPNLGIWTVPSSAYRDATQTRSYFFILRWEWFEWVGIFAPLALFWWFSRMSRAVKGSALNVVSRALILYGLIYFLLALVLTIPDRFFALARLQPMRSLHLLYTFLIIIGGGLLGAHVLKRITWRWLVLFVPLCGGMFFAQRQLFPASAHVEWPGVAPTNDWLRAFDWIRVHTPQDAIFAMDPKYMLRDDQHGFRAIAERSRLADAVKDSGAVTMFPEPPFAEHWLEQVSDQDGWQNFGVKDLRYLEHKYGVRWVILKRPGLEGVICPYENGTLVVCRLD